MKRLNNKGYMIVEIIVASVIAMTIAYFLMDLVVKLKEKYDYVQNDTILMADKTVITNEILGDLYNSDIVCAKTANSVNGVKFRDEDDNELRVRYSETKNMIIYEKRLKGDSKYTPLYQKKFNELLIITSPEISVDEDNKIASFIIKAETLTSTKNYGVNIILPVDKVCES